MVGTYPYPKANTKLLDVLCGEGLILRETLRRVNPIKEFGLGIFRDINICGEIKFPEIPCLLADGQRYRLRISNLTM